MSVSLFGRHSVSFWGRGRRAGILVLFLIILTPSPGWPSREAGRFSISSNKMTIRSLENRVIFEGDVKIDRDDLQMTAERVQVYFEGPPPNGSFPALGDHSSISRIEAQGNVQIRQGERRARSERAVFDQKNEKIILMGSAEAWGKDYRIRGSRMTFFLKEDRGVVEGSRMTIIPKKGSSPAGRK